MAGADTAVMTIEIPSDDEGQQQQQQSPADVTAPSSGAVAAVTFDMDDEAAHCPICSEGLLNKSQSVASLKCGHMFHEDCVRKWMVFNQSSSRNALQAPNQRVNGCPVCKTVTALHEVHTLNFEFCEVVLPQEKTPLEDPDNEEGAALRKLRSACEEEEQELEKLEKKAADSHEALGEVRLQRQEAVAQAQRYEEECSNLQEQLEKVNSQVASLRASLDHQLQLQRRIKVERPKPEDADVREERRVLANRVREGDRAQNLHEGLVAAMKEEASVRENRKEQQRLVQVVQKEQQELMDREHRLKGELQEAPSSGGNGLGFDSCQLERKRFQIEMIASAGKVVAEAEEGDYDPLTVRNNKIKRVQVQRSLSDVSSNTMISNLSSDTLEQDSQSRLKTSQRWGAIFTTPAKVAPSAGQGIGYVPATQAYTPPRKEPKMQGLFARQKP